MSSALTLEQVLALHPWPAEFAKEPRLEWLWHFEVALPVATVWPIVADSSRMNRALGVQEMKFEDRGSERWGSSAPLGIAQEWLEVPWNWLAGEWIESLRVYKRGFSKAVWGVFVFTPLDEHRTRVSVYFGAVPRNFFGRLINKLGFPTLEKDFVRVFKEVTEQVGALKPVFELPPRDPLPPEAESRLSQIRERLLTHALDAKLIDKLIEWIRTGDELDLFRIQIRERARAWKVDEQELLRVALHATREGLLDISWDLICPHCRGPTSKAEALGDLKAKGVCEVCQIDFGSNTPESVEITFHVHPTIREITVRTFCSAEPAKKDHIRLQRDVKPGESCVVEPRLGSGRWRLRTHGSKAYGVLDTHEGVAGALEWKATEQPKLEGAPKPRITLINDSTEPRRFVLEAAGWNDFALRPAQLFNLQEYRDLFSEDYLAADVQLAIGEQTILFTDIVGSTAMYAQRGDPAAFMEVKKHFTEVFPLVAKNRGAVVKTIGDAIMASFTDPLDAVKTCAEIHALFHKDRQDSATRLRISLNTGPCIAVKLNASIDYFGQTVNLAAKLQSLAEAGEVALSDSVWGARGVKDFLQGRAVEDVAYESKALAAPVPVKRWKCF
jgi:class 3 adenylate cyclase